MQRRYIKEAWVQAELYRRLVNLGYEVYSEVRLKWLRADLALYWGGKLALLIEVKNRKRNYKVNPKTKQYNKYADLGIPFMYCMSSHHIQEVVDKILKEYPLHPNAQEILERKIARQCAPLTTAEKLGL